MQSAALGAYGAPEGNLPYAPSNLADLDVGADQFWIERAVQVPDLLRRHAGRRGQFNAEIAVAV